MVGQTQSPSRHRFSCPRYPCTMNPKNLVHRCREATLWHQKGEVGAQRHTIFDRASTIICCSLSGVVTRNATNNSSVSCLAALCNPDGCSDVFFSWAIKPSSRHCWPMISKERKSSLNGGRFLIFLRPRKVRNAITHPFAKSTDRGTIYMDTGLKKSCALLTRSNLNELATAY